MSRLLGDVLRCSQSIFANHAWSMGVLFLPSSCVSFNTRIEILCWFRTMPLFVLRYEHVRNGLHSKSWAPAFFDLDMSALNSFCLMCTYSPSVYSLPEQM